MSDHQPSNTQDLMPRNLKRLSARLTKMIYSATHQAIKDASIDLTIDKIPIIFGSAMSEIDSGQELVRQIHQTKGVNISPTAVQNSVHNAPAGFLSIGLQNQEATITIAHSFLSWETSIDYAFTLLSNDEHHHCLVVAGDQYINEWHNLLELHGQNDLSNQLKSMFFREGAQAVLLSTTLEKAPKCYGKINRSIVFHLPNGEGISRDLINELGFQIHPHTIIILREYLLGSIPPIVDLAKRLGLPPKNIHLYKSNSGNYLSSPLSCISDYFTQKNHKHLIFLSMEYSDLAIVEIEII